ncbi:MAG: acylphosphatase [Alphaproteobacteria bacterium]
MPTTPATPTVVQIAITGHVQGVWFRGWTVETATELGLDGWVRNRRDGTVEALFAGPQNLVEAMVKKCRQGPRLARVDQVTQLATDPGATAPTTGFHQQPTV